MDCPHVRAGQPQCRTVQPRLARRARARHSPGDQCFNPYPCPYMITAPGHRLAGASDRRVAGFERRAPMPCGRKGLPPSKMFRDFSLQDCRVRVRRCVLGQTDYVSPGLRDALLAPTFPIHHLDFETFMPALPRYPSTHPYQTLLSMVRPHRDRRWKNRAPRIPERS